jgi:hypothetical protein
VRLTHRVHAEQSRVMVYGEARRDSHCELLWLLLPPVTCQVERENGREGTYQHVCQQRIHAHRV